MNGFNVTNSFRNLNFSKIPFEAIAEQQVKTGGYGAEFGRSLGGVVSQTTKRGTNEFESGSSLYFIPGGLRASTRNANHSNPLEPSSLGTARSIDSEEDTSEWTANVWAGGPHGNVCQYVQHDRDDGQPRTSLAPRALQAPRFFQFSVQYQF